MRLAVAAGALMALLLAVGLSIGTAPTPAAAVAVTTIPDRLPPGAVVKHLRHLGLSSDSLSPPGCLRIVGQPLPESCLPCPPLWLGGPTVQCISIWSGSVSTWSSRVTSTLTNPSLPRIAFCPVRARYALMSGKSAGILADSITSPCGDP